MSDQRAPLIFAGAGRANRCSVTEYAAPSDRRGLEPCGWRMHALRRSGLSGAFGPELTQEASVVGPHELLDEPSAVIEPEDAYEVPSSRPATHCRSTTSRACASRRYAALAAPESRSRNHTPSPSGSGSNPTSSQTRDGSSGPVPATPPSSARGPASSSQGSPSPPATGPRDSGSSPPASGSPWCPASPPRRYRAACAGSRSTTTPAGSGGPSGRRPMTIRAQPRPPWSTPWSRRSVPRRAAVHRIGLIGAVTVRVRPADRWSSESADRHRDHEHDREARDERPLPTQPTVRSCRELKGGR